MPHDDLDRGDWIDVAVLVALAVLVVVLVVWISTV